MGVYYANETDDTVIEHYGIKGQKWGVRRFQNPDGTLTAAGKKRYGNWQMDQYRKSEIDKFGKVLKKASAKGDTAKANYAKEQISTLQGMTSADLRNEVLGMRQAGSSVPILSSYVKNKTRKERLEQENLKKQRLEREEKVKKLKTKISSIENEPAIQQNEFFDEHPEKYFKDADYKKKWDKVADLGLKTLRRVNPYLPKYDDEIRQMGYTEEQFESSARNWFLFEDQTFGMPTVAHLINIGVPVNKVKKLISTATDFHYNDLDGDIPIEEVADGKTLFFIQDINLGQSPKDRVLERFADECYKTLKEQYK